MRELPHDVSFENEEVILRNYRGRVLRSHECLMSVQCTITHHDVAKPLLVCHKFIEVKIEIGDGDKNTYILTRRPSTPPLYGLQTPLPRGPHEPVLSATSAKAMGCEFTIPSLHEAGTFDDVIHKCFKARATRAFAELEMASGSYCGKNEVLHLQFPLQENLQMGKPYRHVCVAVDFRVFNIGRDLIELCCNSMLSESCCEVENKINLTFGPVLVSFAENKLEPKKWAPQGRDLICLDILEP